MSRLAARWNDYWFRPAPAFDLGLFRVLVAGFHTFVLLFPHALLMYPPYTSFDELAAWSRVFRARATSQEAEPSSPPAAASPPSAGTRAPP